MVRLLPVVLIVALAACSRASQPVDPAAATTPATGGGPAGAAAPAPAPVKPIPAELPAVVARVNNDAISKADFERAVQTRESSMGGPVPATERDRVFRLILDDLIGYRLLVQETARQKVSVPDAEVDAQVDKIRARFQSQDAFTRALAQQKVTLEKLREDTRQALEIEKLLKTSIGSKADVKSEEIAAFYEKNPQFFQQPEQVHASHILIRVPQGAEESVKKAAREKIETVLKSARAGKDFGALAKEYSEDPGSAAGGGDLGTFPQGQMVGPFNDVAFKLAPGTISDIVETEFGYHIIKVHEKTAGRAVPIDEARPKIENHLQQVNRQRETQAFVMTLRSRGKVEIFI